MTRGGQGDKMEPGQGCQRRELFGTEGGQDQNNNHHLPSTYYVPGAVLST